MFKAVLIVYTAMFGSWTENIKDIDTCLARAEEVYMPMDAKAKKIDTDKAWDIKIICVEVNPPRKFK
jgi:hypothetical protein